MKIIFPKNNKGFTLVEMLVSIALFAIVLVITLGSIMTIVDVNRKSQSLTIVMNDLNFALENITRSVKTGDIQVADSNTPRELYVIEDLKNQKRDVKYIFEGGSIKRQVRDDNTEPWGQAVSVTSDQIKIEDASFLIYGSKVSGDSRQPRVLITVSGTAMVGPTISSKFHIQTTVSQRRLEVTNAGDNFGN